MMRSFRSSKSGSVVTVFAFSSMVLAVMTAIVVNQVSFYMSKRRLQSAVDMTTLIMMQSGNVESSHAKALIAGQINEPNVKVTVTRGRYTPNANVAVSKRFVANATPYNAIQVDAAIPADKVMLGNMLPDNITLKASARAARRQTASLAVGSRLVRVEGGLSAALLDATLGYKGKLTVMNYESLASAKIDTVKFLQALNTGANIKAVTFDDVLDAKVTVGQVLTAMTSTMDNGAAKTLLKAANPASTNKIQLENVIQLGSIANLPLDALTSGGAFPLSAGEILAGSVSLADGDHQVALNLAAVLGDASIANVSLDIGQKPQILRYDAYAEEGSGVSTSQFGLTVGALGTGAMNLLAVDVKLASASVEIDDIACHSNGKADVTVKAVTEAAKVGVKAPLLPKINLLGGSNEKKTLSFSPTDIQNATYKPVRSGLGLQVGGLNLTQLLLIKPVDNLLVKLGLNVAEADVKVFEANCGSAGLVN